MTIRLMLLTATALLLSSCDTGKENANGSSSEAAVSVSSTADEEAIRGQVARWLELVKAKDAAPGALSARSGVPSKPVSWQNAR